MRLLFVVNHAPFFVSHRLPIAEEMLRRGNEVALAYGYSGNVSNDKKACKIVENARINLLCHRMIPDSLKFIYELLTVSRILWLIFTFKPDLVHLVSPKCNFYGGLICRILRINYVCAISGFGSMMTSQGNLTKKAKTWITFKRWIFGRSFDSKKCQVIVQNSNDYTLVSNASTRCEINLIRGSGIDLDVFKVTNLEIESKRNIVLFPARVLKDKGIREFCYAAKQLKIDHPHWSFLIAGDLRYPNPSTLSEEEIAFFSKFPVEFLGHRDSIVSLLKTSKITCLPSYREGMPKSLLEAAAMGCAVVTTDAPGCKEAIIEGQTGLLVRPYDAKDLTEKLHFLLKDEAETKRLGFNGVEFAKGNFSIQSVINLHLGIYERAVRVHG